MFLIWTIAFLGYSWVTSTQRTCINRTHLVLFSVHGYCHKTIGTYTGLRTGINNQQTTVILLAKKCRPIGVVQSHPLHTQDMFWSIPGHINCTRVTSIHNRQNIHAGMLPSEVHNWFSSNLTCACSSYANIASKVTQGPIFFLSGVRAWCILSTADTTKEAATQVYVTPVAHYTIHCKPTKCCVAARACLSTARTSLEPFYVRMNFSFLNSIAGTKLDASTSKFFHRI